MFLHLQPHDDGGAPGGGLRLSGLAGLGSHLYSLPREEEEKQEEKGEEGQEEEEKEEEVEEEDYIAGVWGASRRRRSTAAHPQAPPLCPYLFRIKAFLT